MKARPSTFASESSFARRFRSEAALQQVIAGLLTRLPDVSNVQILQGTQEYGKDLIFSIRGAFGEAILCAGVIKNTRITGSAGSSKGARTVLIQAEQAFDTPHLADNGSNVKVERVYIITPFDLAPATIRNGWIRSRQVAASGTISSARTQVNPPAPSVCE